MKVDNDFNSHFPLLLYLMYIKKYTITYIVKNG